MSRNWILGLVALVIWVAAYTWYFIGVDRVRETTAKLWRKLIQRRSSP